MFPPSVPQTGASGRCAPAKTQKNFSNDIVAGIINNLMKRKWLLLSVPFPAGCSDVESEVHYVAVLHHVFLPFHSEASGFTHGGLAAEVYVVVVFDYFGADEPFLEVGVDDSGALRGF